jgi:hypothetical protein
MHQTFYIDVDEEITSTIERIHKAIAEEIVVVVPKGALLIQSIINLKLLKKEADSLGKEVIIVTQDKIGKLLVEKAGILAQQRLEDVEGNEWEEVPEKEIAEVGETLKEQVSSDVKKYSKKRLDKIGSSDFFDNKISNNETENLKFSISAEKENDGTEKESEKILNRELVAETIKDEKREGSIFRKKSASMDLIKNISIKQKQSDDLDKKTKPSLPSSNFGLKNAFLSKRKLTANKKNVQTGDDDFKEEKVEKFFSGTDNFFNYNRTGSDKTDNFKKPAKPERDINLPAKFWKFFLIFGLIVIFIAASLFLYLFLPKAKVTVFFKTKSQSIDAEITASIKEESVNLDGKLIPAKLISFTDEFSKKFQSSSEKAASSRKARGTITIYNEYSTASQPLIATTRFLSSDGKLFRLVSGVTIPGMTRIGSEIKPGAVEAEVVADEAGDDFNIGPASFSIPGFQGSGAEKYSKFYAKSFKSMLGGGSGSETAKAVSSGDIESAKKEVFSEFEEMSKQKIKDQSGDGYVISNDALNISDVKYSASNSAGDLTNEFAVSVTAKINAIVFAEKDMKEVVKKMLEKSSAERLGITEKTLALDYGKSDADFTNGIILVRVHGEGKTESGVDLENLKKGILGKTNEELEAYLKTYPDFYKADVEYWPSFINKKMPIYESRLEAFLDNN